MIHERNKKILVLASCLCAICVTSGIVSVIPEYSKSYLLNTSIQYLAKKLGQLIKNPIIISSDLTASEALYQDNYEIVTKLILNKIQDDLGSDSLTINGISYPTSNIIKDLKIILPSTVSYDDYQLGSISNVKIEYVTSKQTIDITTNNNSSYTVQGFLVPTISSINQTIANILSLHIKNPIQINDSLNASQALQTNNIVNTIDQIKASIRNDLNNKDITINNNIVVPINELLSNINITLPNTITSSELDSGIINNVVLKYENKNNITNIIASNGSKTFTVIGFNIPNDNETQLQNTAIVNELDKLIKNPITLANGFGLTAAQSISSDANKQILFNAIKEVIKNELGTNFTINSISYETSEILQNITINVPNSVTTSQNNNQTIPNVTLSYKNIELKNSNGINYTVTNLAKVTNENTNQAAQNEKIAQQLSQIIKNPIQLLKGYAYSAQQSLSSSNYILLFKQAIIAAIENYITVNNIVVDGISYSKNTILNNIDILTLLQGVTYSQNEQVEVNNIVALYYGQPLGNSSIDSSISKPIYNSSSTNSWDVTGFSVANINNTNWQSVNNNIATQLSSIITNPIIINGAYTAKQYVASYPNELQELISNKVCSEVSTFYEDGLKITPQELKQFLEVELPNSNDVAETENDNAELNNVNLIYNYPQNSENDAANIIPSGASYYTIKGFLTPQQIQNKAIANYLSSIIPNPIVLPYNTSTTTPPNTGYNATFPFTDGYKNAAYYNYSTEQYELLFRNSADALLAFQQEIINVISSYITTSNVTINGTVYDKSNILKNIQVTLLLKGVTYNEIMSGNVDNMISLFYGDNSQTNNLMPINNSSSKNSWSVYGFAAINSYNDNGIWYANTIICDKLGTIFNSNMFNIYTSYTAQEYCNACNNEYDEQKNKTIINTVDNLVLNAVHEQIPDNGILINGIILTKDILIKYMNSIGWQTYPPYAYGNKTSNAFYINYNSPLNYDSVWIIPSTANESYGIIVFNQINN